MDRRIIIHAAFVLALPLIVAAFGLSVVTAVLLVIVALAWRWAIVLVDIVRPRRQPDLVLESISVSHFVEKVRWCMDRLRLDYTEAPKGGTLGAFFTGRTVPRLHFRSGMTRSRIGNSAEILRYLWGAYGASRGDEGAFLAPTAERVHFEKRLDRYGANLQVWVYYHILHDAEICKRAWGIDDAAVPWWQRRLVGLAYPLQAFMVRRAFDTSRDHYERVCHHIEELLGEIDTNLADGRVSILGDDEINYTDLAFAAMTGLWLQLPGYGAGKADAVRLPLERYPEPMRADIGRWQEDYPRAVAFVTRLYAEERVPKYAMAGANGDTT